MMPDGAKKTKQIPNFLYFQFIEFKLLEFL